MNKKFLSAILFGALMVTSTGTFVSCKDYDDDIENLQGQISANSSAIAELKTLIQNGDYVTNVEVSGQNLVVSFKNAGTKNVALPECEGGAKAEIKEGELYIDGKATGVKVGAEFQEAVKIVEGEWAVLQEDGTYKSTGIKASSIAVSGDEQSGYTLTVTDAEGVATTIKLPTAATLISEIEFLNEGYQTVLTDPRLDVYYWYAGKTTKWNGPKGNIPAYSNTYSVDYKGDADITLRYIRISPASVDASAIDFKLVDTKDVEAAVTLKASRYDGTLTRAAGESGLYGIKAVSGVFTYGSDANKFVKGFKTGSGLTEYKALALKPSSANYKSLFNVKVVPVEKEHADLGGIYFGSTKVVNAVEGTQISTPQIYVGQKATLGVENEFRLYDMYLSATAEDVELFGLEFSEDGRSFKATKSPDNVTDATIDLFVHTLSNKGGDGEIKKTTITVEINRSLGSATYEKQTIMPTKVNDIFLVSADKLKESLGSDLNAWYASVKAGTSAATVWSTAIYTNEACTTGADVSAGQLTMTLVKDKDNAVTESNIGSALNQLKFQLNINKTTKPLKIGTTYYAKISFTDKATNKTLNSIVVPFELTKPELSTILVKENGVFADGNDLAYAYMNATDNNTANSRYLIKRAFVDMATKLANANMTTWSFVENDNAGKVVGNNYTSDIADVWNNSGEWTISLDPDKKDDNGVTLGYKKDLNVAFVGYYLDVAEDTWKYVHTYQFRVMSPIAEGKYQAANDVIEIAATGETNVAKDDVWAFTYNNDVKYELFKVAKFNASTNKYAEAWDREDIKSVTFTAANTNIFTVVTANPTAIKIKNQETGELERESFVTFKGMGLQAGQESEVNITVEDIWGYKLSAKVKVKTTVNP